MGTSVKRSSGAMAMSGLDNKEQAGFAVRGLERIRPASRKLVETITGGNSTPKAPMPITHRDRWRASQLIFQHRSIASTLFEPTLVSVASP